jgi:hypothetical protein
VGWYLSTFAKVSLYLPDNSHNSEEPSPLFRLSTVTLVPDAALWSGDLKPSTFSLYDCNHIGTKHSHRLLLSNATAANTIDFQSLPISPHEVLIFGRQCESCDSHRQDSRNFQTTVVFPLSRDLHALCHRSVLCEIGFISPASVRSSSNFHSLLSY